MQLDTSRFFSDRVIFDSSIQPNLQITNSLWDWCRRIIAWIWSPASYSDENIRTITCFRKYLIDTLGQDRFQRICSRYSIDFDQMARKGGSLLSCDVAKIVVGAKNVTVEDINDFIRKSPDPRFAGKNSLLDLDSATLTELHQALSKPFEWEVGPITKTISGMPTEWISRLFFDPFLADRERLQIIEGHPNDLFETFVHNMVARVIKREMDIGTLIPAPNHPDGRRQFYYVSAKVVTGKGMVSYLFHPATSDTNLEPIRLFRGTSIRNSDLDALSTMITDLEPNLGESAYKSGLVYDRIIRERLVEPAVEAGHSMGSTVVQYRLANTDHIRKAYLYCGPGVPEQEAEKFNQKNLPIQLVIRTVATDPWNTLGEVHLGYRAPPNVDVDFVRYHPPKKNHHENPHVTVWGKERYFYGIEGGMSPEIRDRELYYKHSSKERVRSLLGPIFAYLLRLIRHCLRSLAGTRAEIARGLQIGTMQGRQWQVDHFRAI